MKKRKFLSRVAIVTAISLFAAFGFGGCKKETDELFVCAPDGAPALALAKAMSEDEADDGVRYEIVDASTISTYVKYDTPNDDKNADVCVMPLGAASKLLGKGDRYQALGVVTHGNLYMLSTDETQYTQDNLSDLIGKTVGVVQLLNVPGDVFKVILTEADIPWRIVGNDGEIKTDHVNLRAVTPDQVLPTEGIDVFVAPEPAASVKVKLTDLQFVGDLQALYGGESGYPQAVIVAKRSVLERNGAFITALTEDLTASATWLAETEISEICSVVSSHLTEGLTPSLTSKNLTADSLKNSSVWFTGASTCRAEMDGFLQKIVAVGGTGAAVQSAFYYGVED